MELGLYPKLTKDYILERITQEEIMERYLGIKVVFNTLVNSPLRTDSNPTCSFYYNDKGRLRFRDWSGHFWGDCFDVVAHYLHVGTSKKEFMLILHTIAKDFRIHRYVDSKEVNKYNLRTKEFFQSRKKKKSITIFKIVPRRIENYDRHYWQQFNVNEALLNRGRVFFAQEILISKDGLPFVSIYRYIPKDPAYCYFGGKYPNGIDKWKIYFPYRKAKGELGFLSNASFLQGEHLLTPDRVCIVTKSYKDVLTFASIGLQAIAPSAESVLITKSEYYKLKQNFDFIVSCMDYGIENKLDRAGIRMALKLRNTYGIQPFMFTNGMFNTTNFTGKDVSDYVKAKGINSLVNVIKSIYNQHRNDFQNLDKYYYESLKFINENY